MYTSQRILQTQTDPMNLPMLLDPALLRAARQIYRTYSEVHPDRVQSARGVAINRFHHRGQLIFSEKPILLPEEYFVPFNEIESEAY